MLFLYSYLELKQRSLDRGYICMYSGRHGDKVLKKVVRHKLRTAIMSPSLDYCRMPASTPICVRMVLVEL